MFAPGHSRERGELLIGGVRSSELASAYGTPLLALDFGVLGAAIAEFSAAFSPHAIEIAYAGKALLPVALARYLQSTPLHLDVCSLGELTAAEQAGYPAQRMTLHGCGKTRAELDAAREGRVGRIVVDNLDELRSLCAHPAAQPLIVLLRINTGIEAHTHEFVRTSGEHSKFGFDQTELDSALSMLASAPHIRFTGLHSHIGSQIYERAAFAANAKALMESAAQCARSGFTTSRLIVGGGFGVADKPGEAALDLAKAASEISTGVREQAKARGLPVPSIGIEPGRAIVAAAGTSLYSVMARKRQFGRAYVIVDGGVYENPRPALYDAYHHTICASRESADEQVTIVCGRTCENDRLASAYLPSDIGSGDLVAMCTTGAYTFSMASNYNRFTRPAVAAVRDGEHHAIVRRETTSDILRMDIDV